MRMQMRVPKKRQRLCPRAVQLGLAMLVLPSSASAYESVITEMVLMRDGIRLATDAYWPSRPGRFHTVLIRTPYGKDMVPPEVARLVCDGMGYALVVQDTRGTGASEGINDVFMSDGWSGNMDGWDTVEWLLDQRFANSEVGVFGVSALGITSYMLLGTWHPNVVAAHVGIAPWIFYNTVYQSGCYRDALVTNWMNSNGGSQMLPLYQEHPIYDDLWATLDLRTRASGIDVPIFHWGGYYDIFTEGPLDAFSQMSLHASDQLLLMGPWTHMDSGAFSPTQGELSYPPDSIIPMDFANPITFFDVYLKGKIRTPAQPEDYPVRFYVMGDVDNPDGEGNHWEIAQKWPLDATDRVFYLQPAGQLTSTAPTTNAKKTFTYDPSNPAETIGGAELYLDAGPYDQRPLYNRTDVLRFTSDALTAPVKVVGKVRVELFVSSSAPDTDFTVRLIDVYPDGRAMLVNDGIGKLRYRDSMTEPTFLTPNTIDSLMVETGTTSIVFEEGHRIEILVSSSNAPRFIPSRNNADHIWGDAPSAVAQNSIHLGTGQLSRLILPEPVAGQTRPAPRVSVPSRARVKAALQRFDAGHPLSPSDREVLEVEAGRMLLELGLDRQGY